MGIEIKYCSLDSIHPYEKNPRKNKLAIDKVKNSINAFGFKVPIIVDNYENGEIVCGHTRYEAAKVLGLTEVPCVEAKDLTPEQIKMFRLADNKVAEFSEWDEGLLGEELSDLTGLFNLEDFGFDLDFMDDDGENEAKGSLEDKFLIPPVSILDTKTERWKKRKDFWNSFDLNSGCSRENMDVQGGLSGSVPRYYTQKEKVEKKLGRKLTCKEFEENYLDLSNTNLKFTNSGGLLSLFDPVVAELCYLWFCPKGGTILDPFSGGVTRGFVAMKTGHHYTGIDIRKEQVEANNEAIERIGVGEKDVRPNFICGDSRNCDNIVADRGFDLVFSCPPYADLEKYSDDPSDISNMNYRDFKEAFRDIIRKSVSMLKEDRFAIFVIQEVRDKSSGLYYNLLRDTIGFFEEAGAHFYDDIILAVPFGSVAIRASRNFQSSRKIGKVHQNVLVFYKGNPKNIKTEFGDVEIADIEEDE